MSLRTLYENLSSEEALRRGWEYSLYASSSLVRPAPVYDPIFTPIFTAVFGTAGITIGAQTITFASIASALATTALAIGIQALLAPKPPDPEDGRVPKTQSTPSRVWAVGRNRLAGAYMLWEASGNYLYAVQALVAHRVKSINRYWLHDDEVFIDANGVTTNDDDGRYGDNVRLLTRLGLSTETAYAPIADPLSASGIWTYNHRGDGQASVAMIATSAPAKNQNKRFPYGAPQVSVEVDGAFCWDFRISADPGNPAAWVWTRNSALVLCWHECFNEFGNRRDYRKAILPVLDMWIEEANICDEDVPRASGGTEKRYETNGWDTTDNGPKVGTQAILASCDGWTIERGDGALLLTVGKFRESRVETLTDADIIGHQIQYDVLFEDECNRLVPRFTYPDTGYSTCDTDYFEDNTAQMEAGRVLAKTGDYRYCQQWRQARRLGKRDWLRERQKVRGSIDSRLSGFNAVYCRWVRLLTPVRLPKCNGKVFENRRPTVAITRGGFSMDLIQHPDNIDDWNPVVDEGMQPPVPNTLGTDKIPPGVINTVQAKANGGSVYLRVLLLDPESTSWTPVIFYRVSGSNSAWIEQQFPTWGASGGYVELNTGPVPVDVDLDVQAGYIGSDGSYGPRSPTETVHTTADPTPAGPVINPSVSPGTGNATINWTAPNSGNYAAARIYWNTTNNFATATAVSPPTSGAPNAFSSATITLTAGVKYAWIVSLNRSGVAGTPVATGAFTVS
ncbi:hypothetical protein [Rhizobium sp. WW_1]|jgi:hypothetical protein|uniref:hypothetical protein n=1 Tax=Rhizobium sp. WW_1 TaxID=1907375 RepID=UPI00068C2526|nr:hypothetical protein [Rhizobium sp. WW_1]RKD68965.1 hypothetical protein BJ928_104103 [Rhizobium sp. WW_1]